MNFQDYYIPEPNSGCWLWLHDISTQGYGRIWIKPERIQAHRFSWVKHRGAIPPSKQVLHKCDVRNCVNPDHLFLGDHTVNMKDMAAKGRARGGRRNALKTHCPRGHEYNLENTRVVKNSRSCRKCGTEWARARRGQ